MVTNHLLREHIMKPIVDRRKRDIPLDQVRQHKVADFVLSFLATVVTIGAIGLIIYYTSL